MSCITMQASKCSFRTFFDHILAPLPETKKNGVFKPANLASGL